MSDNRPLTPEEIVVQERNKYRDSLLALQEKNQSLYDKTVLSLSGGSFGVSVLVIKELLGKNAPQGSSSLVVAWTCWGLSIVAVLWSFFASSKAMGRAIEQLDSGKLGKEPIGGIADNWTDALNLASGILFAAGLASFTGFVITRL